MVLVEVQLLDHTTWTKENRAFKQMTDLASADEFQTMNQHGILRKWYTDALHVHSLTEHAHHAYL